jgi:hypothetical protein
MCLYFANMSGLGCGVACLVAIWIDIDRGMMCMVGNVEDVDVMWIDLHAAIRSCQ